MLSLKSGWLLQHRVAVLRVQLEFQNRNVTEAVRSDILSSRHTLSVFRR